MITLGSGFSNPNRVVVDSNGNVFVADTLYNQIKEILAVNGSIPANNPTINTLAGSYNHPTSVAVDSSGNVFVAALCANPTFCACIPEVHHSTNPRNSSPTPRSLVTNCTNHRNITNSRCANPIKK